MIVSSSGKIVAGSKILINETINEFLGIVDNLWNNSANWSLGITPAANHTAIIKADCNHSEGVVIVKTLEVHESSSLTIGINGSLATGTLLNYSVINCNSINSYLSIRQLENVWGSIDFGNSGSLILNMVKPNQVYEVPDLNYYHLYLGSFLDTGLAEPTSAITNFVVNNPNLLVRGDLHIFRKLQINSSNIQVDGNIYIKYLNGANAGYSNVGRLHILNPGISLKVKGMFYKELYSCIKFDGNPEVEIQGGACGMGRGYTYEHNVGNNIWKFTSNNQLLNSNSFQNELNELPNVVIDDIKLTVSPEPYQAGSEFTHINGTTPNSTLENLHYIRLKNTLASDIMQTGRFLTDNANSIVQYILDGNQEIKVPDSHYNELRLSASGVKKLIGNIICDHLYFSDAATLDLNGHTVSGYSKYTDLRDTLLNLPAGLFEDLTFYGQKELSGDLTVTNLYSEAGTIASNGHLLTVTNFYNGAYTLYGLQPSEAIVTNWYNIAGYGAQAVQGGNYQNLYLMGTNSTQILFGNVVVNGEYVRGNNAQIDKNGFTIKDANGNDLE